MITNFSKIGHLFQGLEEMEFECMGGKLRKAALYIIIKDIFYNSLTQDIPEEYIKKYRLNEGRLSDEDKDYFFNNDDD